MRKRFLAPVLAVLLTATLGSASPAPDPPECVVAAAWVRAHHNALPTTLAELSRFSITYRRAIYGELPAATRAALWREHLEGFLRPGQPLTGPQRAALREVIAQLPALTAKRADPARARSLGKHLAGIFGRDLGRQIVATLGPASAPARTADARRPLCDCSFGGAFNDCQGGTCTTNLCSFTGDGCGAFWSEPCNGVCRF
jgi:hypothetical protein